MPHRNVRTFTWLVVLLTLAGCAREPDPVRIDGNIFGTFYQISLAGDFSEARLTVMREGALSVLEAVDASMSTYREDSELMRLNRHPVGEWMPVSAELFTVLRTAQDIAEASGGAFDVTVGGLVNLWTFGPEARPTQVPDEAQLRERLEQVGHATLELDADNQRVRRTRDNFVDLSGIAKGYAVDRVSAWLSAQGAENHLVNIGGDLKARGERNPDRPWRIGIQLPDTRQMDVAQHIIAIRDMSMTGSGDYRNYFEEGGQRYSHTIDPRDGRPINHRLASATVMHPSNMIADGWATAFMVLGTEAAQAMAEEHGLQVLLLSRSGDGWTSWASSALIASYGEDVLKPVR